MFFNNERELMADKIKCSWPFYKCGNTVEEIRNGKWYCYDHDLKRRLDKQNVEKKIIPEIFKAAIKKDRRQQAEANYCMYLTTEYLEAHQACK